MSYDLIVWTGAPTAPSRRWASIDVEPESPEPLPAVALLARWQEALGDRVRVVADGAEGTLEGRGIECAPGPGSWTVVTAEWWVSTDLAVVGGLIRGAHAAGCSVYDPQNGAHWPVSSGPPPADDPWRAAAFDEFFVWNDPDDGGHVPDKAVRLWPSDVWPPERKVWVELPWAVARRCPEAARLRASAYVSRFPGWHVEAVFTGPRSEALGLEECARLLKRIPATPVVAPEVGTVVFVVLADLDACTLAASVDPCPFEIVPASPEELLLESIFGEPPRAAWIWVPIRVLTDAPDTVRNALRSLAAHAEALSGAVHFADPLAAPEAPVGANVAWVEALLGLAPGEVPRAVSAAEVPRRPPPPDDAGEGGPDDGEE